MHVMAPQELNNFELGGRKLTCQRANTQQPRDPLAGLIGYNPLTMGIFPGTAGRQRPARQPDTHLLSHLLP